MKDTGVKGTARNGGKVYFDVLVMCYYIDFPIFKMCTLLRPRSSLDLLRFTMGQQDYFDRAVASI